MSYTMYYTTQIIDNPKISAIPKYVSCLMLSHINEIKLTQSSEFEADKNKESDLMRLLDAFNNFGYRMVKGNNNTIYMFLPSNIGLAIKLTIYYGKSNIDIRKSTMVEVVNNLSDTDIRKNEASGDQLKLGGYNTYKQRVLNLA